MSQFRVKKARADVQAGAYYYEGQAFTIQNARGHQCVVIAPDIESLEDLYMQFCCGALDKAKVQPVACAAPFNFKFDVQDPIATVLKEHKEAKEKDLEIIWVLHPESGSALMEYRMALRTALDLVELGPAVRMTETECKILLRQQGWSKGKIEQVDIHTEHPDETNPF